jgi:hypothetical protein
MVGDLKSTLKNFKLFWFGPDFRHIFIENSFQCMSLKPCACAGTNCKRTRLMWDQIVSVKGSLRKQIVKHSPHTVNIPVKNYCFVSILARAGTTFKSTRLTREQILSVVGSCCYNLLAYEAHMLKNGESRAQTKKIFLLLCTF